MIDAPALGALLICMAAHNFIRVRNWTIHEEGDGVYTNVPPDPPTKSGVTIWALQKYRGPSVKVTPAMVQAMTDETVGAIYRQDYWDLVKGDQLPVGVDLMLFEYAVNPGPGAARTAVQRIVGVPVDGLMGPATLAAIAAYDPVKLIQQLAIERMRYWLSRNNAVEELNERGWMARLLRVQATALAMVEAEKAGSLAQLLPRG